MKLLALILISVLSVAHATPPALPHYTPVKRSPKKLSGSKVGALERTAYTFVAPRKAPTQIEISWTHPNKHQDIEFTIYALNGFSTNGARLVATTTNNFIRLPINSSMQLFGLKARDRMTGKESEWCHR